MLQKITEMWPSLLRGAHNDREEAEQTDLAEPEDENEDEVNIRVDEAQVMEDYKNLYWSRLIAVDGFQVVPDDEGRFRWPMGPEIIEECNFVADLPGDETDSWAPLFDPNAFKDAHGPLEIEKFRLPQEDLKAWALKAVQLRKDIVEKGSAGLGILGEEDDKES